MKLIAGKNNFFVSKPTNINDHRCSMPRQMRGHSLVQHNSIEHYSIIKTTIGYAIYFYHLYTPNNKIIIASAAPLRPPPEK